MFMYMSLPERIIPNKEGVKFQDIIYRIMYKNAYSFIEKNYQN